VHGCHQKRHFESVKGVKKEAHRRLAELMLNIEQGVYTKHPKTLTVAVWLKQWLDSYVKSNLAPKTRESYTHELNNIE